MLDLVDVQNQEPEYKITLDEVGIRDFKTLIKFKIGDEEYNLIAKFTCSISLDSSKRGVHMSRFIESILNNTNTVYESISDLIYKIANECKIRHLKDVFFNIDFLYPYYKEFNGKKELSFADLNITYSTKTNRYNILIKIEGATACPCAKAMCNGLTHNQRAELSLLLEDVNLSDLDFNNILSKMNSSFSSPVFSLLKRVKEREVVFYMHNNAYFVEDVVRNCIFNLKDVCKGYKAKIECISFESIHSHNVFARWKGIF